MSSSTETCCPPDSLPAGEPSTLGQKGVEVEIGGGLRGYLTGHGESAVVVIYDIFGFNGGRVRQVCDQIGDAGFTVLLPDVYHGEAWDPANYPVTDYGPLFAFVGRVGDWETSVRADVFERVLPFLTHQKGVKKIGFIGFCWGVSVVVRACAHGEPIHAGVGVHPSLTTTEMMDQVKCPILWMPAGNDPPLEPFKEVLSKKPFAEKCGYRLFDEMKHGWSVRGDLTDPAIHRDVDECFRLAIEFFKNNL